MQDPIITRFARQPATAQAYGIRRSFHSDAVGTYFQLSSKSNWPTNHSTCTRTCSSQTLHKDRVIRRRIRSDVSDTCSTSKTRSHSPRCRSIHNAQTLLAPFTSWFSDEQCYHHSNDRGMLDACDYSTAILPSSRQIQRPVVSERLLMIT